MWIAGSSLFVLVVTLCVRAVKPLSPEKLDCHDLNRVRRLKEMALREETYPHG